MYAKINCNIEDRDKYHQYTLEELSVADAFFKAHDESLEEERLENEIIEAEKREEKVKKSKYPVLFAELNNDRKANINEKNVQQLYSTAIQGRVAGAVDVSSWELFATDLVLHYYDKIAATPEETKSTLYQRLLNCLEKDYDGKVYELVETYRKR